MWSSLLWTLLAVPAIEARISRDGTCDRQNNCLGSAFGDCCSQHGWCGRTDAYCASGCNPRYGRCNSVSSSKAASIVSSSSISATRTASSNLPSFTLKVSTNARCGSSYGGMTCSGSQWGNCCSQYSYCGSTSDYCSVGCQSGFGICSLLSSSISQTSSRTSSVQSSSPSRASTSSATSSASIVSSVSSSIASVPVSSSSAAASLSSSVASVPVSSSAIVSTTMSSATQSSAVSSSAMPSPSAPCGVKGSVLANSGYSGSFIGNVSPTSDETPCAMACLANPNCQSYNFSSGQKRCNYFSMSLASGGFQPFEGSGFMYYERICASLSAPSSAVPSITTSSASSSSSASIVFTVV